MNKEILSICSVCGKYIQSNEEKVSVETLPSDYHRMKNVHKECADKVLEELQNS